MYMEDFVKGLCLFLVGILLVGCFVDVVEPNGWGFFGKVGAFDEGYEADVVVLDDSNLDHPQQLTVHERLERIAYLGDERNIHAKFVAGTRLF